MIEKTVSLRVSTVYALDQTAPSSSLDCDDERILCRRVAFRPTNAGLEIIQPDVNFHPTFSGWTGRISCTGPDDLATEPGKQNVDRRERLALQHLKSLFTKEVIDVITASTSDMGPLSFNTFKKNNFSASWQVVGTDTSVVDPAEQS